MAQCNDLLPNIQQESQIISFAGKRLKSLHSIPAESTVFFVALVIELRFGARVRSTTQNSSAVLAVCLSYPFPNNVDLYYLNTPHISFQTLSVFLYFFLQIQ